MSLTLLVDVGASDLLRGLIADDLAISSRALLGRITELLDRLRELTAALR